VSKQSLLLVDGDTRSLRVLEVSLRKAGFSVTPAVSVGDALDKLEINPPDLIISETKFATDLDGFELRRRLRGTPEWSEIPFIFLTAETAIENKIKGLELGVDDYLTKPIYIKEIVTRINILLQKKQRQFLDLRKDGTRFAGRVADMPVVDVIQTIEVSRKSGVIQFAGGPNRQAAIYFRDGKVIDAEAGTLQGEDAVYRLLTWNEGEFEVEFRTVRRREVIEMTSQGLLMEGMRRLDEWSRLLEQLPPLVHRFEIDAAELASRLGEVPDDNNRILRLFDGKRTLLEVIDASDFGDLECLQAISRLYFEGLLIDIDPAVRTAQRDTGSKPVVVPPEDSARHQAPATPTPSPIHEASSGAIDLVGLESRAAGGSSTTPPAAEPAKVSLTQTWDVPDVPDDTKAAAPAATPPPLDSTAPVEASDVLASAPVASPTELATEGRPRRDSAQAIDENDVVTEEEIQPPLQGNYRQSSLRLIDEAVAAAQLIEPTLFADDELAALGIKRATPEEIAAAQAAAPPGSPAKATPPAPPPGPSPTAAASASAEDRLPGFPNLTGAERDAALAKAKADLGAFDPSDTPDEPAAPAPSVTRGWDVPDVPDDIKLPEKPAVAAATPASSNGANGRPSSPPPIRGKTLPPPIPGKKPKDMSDEVPLLDADLLQTSGEHKIPSDAELLDSDLLQTSGEIKIPSEAALGGVSPSAPPSKRASAMVAVAPETEPANGAAKTEAKADAKADGKPTPASDEDSGGVPTAIEADSLAERAELEDEGRTDPTRKRAPLSRPDDSAAVRMIGSAGRDRAEASGELKRPELKSEAAATQRELVTIMPRRKTGEVAQLKPEDVSTLDAKGQQRAKAVVEEVEARAAEAKSADAKPETNDTKPAADDKPAKPAVEPPRRVSVEGGVAVPERGPGRGAKILILLASLIAGVAVFSYFKKKSKKVVATERQDAGDRIVMEPPDAPDYNGFGVDAAVVQQPSDAAVVATNRKDASVRADAAVAMITPDAAVVAMRPDAAVAVPRPDAAVVVATGDAGTTAPAGGSATALATKGREELSRGEPAKALDLFDQSLKIKKDKRVYVDRGRALHNLGRTDEAIASIDEAIKMSNTYAPAWEQKGLILWSAQRYGDARPALEMYLSLQPEGPKADTIRKMLDEPR